MSIEKTAGDANVFNVALVSMPWSIYNRPSIQLGVLKSSLLHHDPSLKIDCHHHYLHLARRLGPETYHWLTLSGWAGEALYAPLLFPGMTTAADALFEHERKRFRKNNQTSGYEVLSRQVGEALAEWLASIPWGQYDLIGFSVCFNQLLPSLAAARLIKETAPATKIVFGGSACGGQVGHDLPANFKQIDHLIRGEGEQALIELVQQIQDKDGLPANIIIDGTGNTDLKMAIAPDYRDYFRELAVIFKDLPIMPVIPVEFSRGCWWGKCSFCNLNLQWCGYRFKGAEQMYREVAKLAIAFGCLDFSFTDNVLPVREARKFFRRTAGAKEDYRFFAEIRATQRDDLAAYGAGGVNVVQAGIEALSTSLLNRMRKGVTAIENLAVLKQALKEGIILEGNLITEFPSSTEDEVRETLRCLDFAIPFQPLATASFFLGLDSPVDCLPEDFGIHPSGPHRNYFYLYPAELLKNQEMLVKDFRGGKMDQRRLWRPVVKRVKEWQNFQRHRNSAAHRFPLSYRDGGEFLIIRQEQLGGPVLNHRLRGLSRKIYLFCGEICEISSLHGHFATIGQDPLVQFLAEMVDKKLMFREGDRIISLAIHSGKGRYPLSGDEPRDRRPGKF